MRSHPTQRVALVTADGTSKRFNTLMGIHVTLSRTGCRTGRTANGTSPTTGRTGASVHAPCLDYRLALGTPRGMVLRIEPLRTVEGLMSDEIIHGSEFDTTRCTDQLHQWWRRSTRRRRTVTHRGLSCLAIMFLVSDKVLVSTENNVAFFASGDTLFNQDSGNRYGDRWRR